MSLYRCLCTQAGHTRLILRHDCLTRSRPRIATVATQLPYVKPTTHLTLVPYLVERSDVSIHVQHDLQLHFLYFARYSVDIKSTLRELECLNELTLLVLLNVIRNSSGDFNKKELSLFFFFIFVLLEDIFLKVSLVGRYFPTVK